MNRSLLLLLSGAIVLTAATGGVAFLTTGATSPHGGVFHAPSTAGARQITPTSTVLSTSAASPVPPSTALTLTATITPATAAGTVQFKNSSANIGDPVTVNNGTASTTTSTLTVGSHQLTAVFTPTNPAQFSPSTSPVVPFTISGPTATSAALSTSAASPVPAGTPLTLTATVTPPAAAGTVQFKDGSTNLGAPAALSNGTASTTSTLAVGAHQLTAVFTPANAALYGPSSSPAVPFTVSGATATSTTLTTSSASPTVAGTPVTLTAMVSPTAAAGTVQFQNGGINIGDPVTVSGGTASTTTTTLPVGSNQLTAVFTPTNTALYSPSTSPVVTFTVAGPTATSTTLRTNPTSPVLERTPVTLTATITPSTAAGTVRFRDGNTDIGDPVAVTNGTATRTATLPVGSNQLTAVFTPTNTALFGPSTSQVITFVVNRRPLVEEAVAVVPGRPGQPAPRRGPVLLKATGMPDTASGTVQFLDGSVPLDAPVPVIAGSATLITSTLTPGTHLLTAVFTPDPATDHRAAPSITSLTIIGEIGGTLVDPLVLEVQRLVERIIGEPRP